MSSSFPFFASLDRAEAHLKASIQSKQRLGKALLAVSETHDGGATAPVLRNIGLSLLETPARPHRRRTPKTVPRAILDASLRDITPIPEEREYELVRNTNGVHSPFPYPHDTTRNASVRLRSLLDAAAESNDPVEASWGDSVSKTPLGEEEMSFPSPSRSDILADRGHDGSGLLDCDEEKVSLVAVLDDAPPLELNNDSEYAEEDELKEGRNVFSAQFEKKQESSHTPFVVENKLSTQVVESTVLPSATIVSPEARQGGVISPGDAEEKVFSPRLFRLRTHLAALRGKDKMKRKQARAANEGDDGVSEVSSEYEGDQSSCSNRQEPLSRLQQLQMKLSAEKRRFEEARRRQLDAYPNSPLRRSASRVMVLRDVDDDCPISAEAALRIQRLEEKLDSERIRAKRVKLGLPAEEEKPSVEPFAHSNEVVDAVEVLREKLRRERDAATAAVTKQKKPEEKSRPSPSILSLSPLDKSGARTAHPEEHKKPIPVAKSSAASDVDDPISYSLEYMPAVDLDERPRHGDRGKGGKRQSGRLLSTLMYALLTASCLYVLHTSDISLDLSEESPLITMNGLDELEVGSDSDWSWSWTWVDAFNDLAFLHKPFTDEGDDIAALYSVPVVDTSSSPSSSPSPSPVSKAAGGGAYSATSSVVRNRPARVSEEPPMASIPSNVESEGHISNEGRSTHSVSNEGEEEEGETEDTFSFTFLIFISACLLGYAIISSCCCSPSHTSSSLSRSHSRKKSGHKRSKHSTYVSDASPFEVAGSGKSTSSSSSTSFDLLMSAESTSSSVRTANSTNTDDVSSTIRRRSRSRSRSRSPTHRSIGTVSNIDGRRKSRGRSKSPRPSPRSRVEVTALNHAVLRRPNRSRSPRARRRRAPTFVLPVQS